MEFLKVTFAILILIPISLAGLVVAVAKTLGRMLSDLWAEIEADGQPPPPLPPAPHLRLQTRRRCQGCGQYFDPHGASWWTCFPCFSRDRWRIGK